jgi:hypothetical protein
MVPSRNLVFWPLMQLAFENSRAGRAQASYVVSFRKVLSPLAVVPTPAQMEWAIEQGRQGFAPHLPVVRKILEHISPSEALAAPSLTTPTPDRSNVYK